MNFNDGTSGRPSVITANACMIYCVQRCSKALDLGLFSFFFFSFFSLLI